MYLSDHIVYDMTYRFMHPLPSTVLTQVAASPVIDSKLVSRTALVVQNPPVELMIRRGNALY